MATLSYPPPHNNSTLPSSFPPSPSLPLPPLFHIIQSHFPNTFVTLCWTYISKCNSCFSHFHGILFFFPNYSLNEMLFITFLEQNGPNGPTSYFLRSWTIFQKYGISTASLWFQCFSRYHLVSQKYHLIHPCYSFPLGVLTVLYHIYVRPTDKESSLVLFSSFLTRDCF